MSDVSVALKRREVTLESGSQLWKGKAYLCIMHLLRRKKQWPALLVWGSWRRPVETSTFAPHASQLALSSCGPLETVK